MDLSRAVDFLKEFLGQFVGSFQAEDDHAQMALGGHFKALVTLHHLLEVLCQFDALHRENLQLTQN